MDLRLDASWVDYLLRLLGGERDTGFGRTAFVERPGAVATGDLAHLLRGD